AGERLERLRARGLARQCESLAAEAVARALTAGERLGRTAGDFGGTTDAAHDTPHGSNVMPYRERSESRRKAEAICATYSVAANALSAIAASAPRASGKPSAIQAPPAARRHPPGPRPPADP